MITSQALLFWKVSNQKRTKGADGGLRGPRAGHKGRGKVGVSSGGNVRVMMTLVMVLMMVLIVAMERRMVVVMMMMEVIMVMVMLEMTIVMRMV